MASRGLALSSSLKRHSWSPRILSCTSFPFDHYKQQENKPPQPPPFSLIHIRSFSVVDEDKSTYRERARERAQAARDRARDEYRKGSEKARAGARKGAKTAKEMMRQYGPVFVGTYMSVYFLTWGALFVGIDSGLLDPVQIMGYIGGGVDEGKSTVHVVVEYMEKYEWTRPYAATVERNPHFASLAVAWLTTKFTEPLRLAVTLGVVPKLARYFGFVHVDEKEVHKEGESVEGDIVDTKEEKASKPEEQSTSQKLSGGGGSPLS